MTEWDASHYTGISALQRAMADEVLGLLKLNGPERVLDIGCGSGAITAEIAARLPQGSILGVDASAAMIQYAKAHAPAYSNLSFNVVDARRLPFHQEFDLVVSFNALHWIPEQEQPLEAIHSAMKPGAHAHLRLVPKGAQKSIEDVLEETCRSEKWAAYFCDFRDPYLHLTADEYAELARRVGFELNGVSVGSRSWDFGSRAGFFAFSSVTTVEWTRMLPEEQKPAFINEVLDRYQVVTGKEGVFEFYQMDVSLRRP